MRQYLNPAILVALALWGIASPSYAARRLDVIRQRGVLTCGIELGIAGFAEVDTHGRHTGFDVDICRAISAAIFGTPDKVTYLRADSVENFLKSDQADIVSRRLTWSLTREGLGLLFGPVTFYDGQGFLVPKRVRATSARQLSSARVCVAPGTLSEFNVVAYFRANNLTLNKVLLTSADGLSMAFQAGRCDAYTADVSELGAIRSKMPGAGDFAILADQISKEPLAQLVRQDDVAFFEILRWTVFAIINAEELGITSSNVDEMLTSSNPDVKRLLGVTPGNGKALGLDERWAYRIIKTIGNYGEIFERNVGSRSPIKLARGLNKLWTEGGLIYAPPLR